MAVDFKKFFKLLLLPLVVLGTYLAFQLIWRLFNLPTNEQLITITHGWFERYGLLVIFVSAIIEGTLLLGQYYPGGLVIFLGVISAGHNVPRIIAVVAVVSLSFFIGYSIDYFVGKYGWYKIFLKFGLKKSLDSSQEKLQKHQLNAVILSYWEPNLASVTATAAGVLQLPLGKFSTYSLIGIVVWNTIWGILVASLGSRALELIGLKWVLIIFSIWIAVILVKHYFFSKPKNEINLP